MRSALSSETRRIVRFRPLAPLMQRPGCPALRAGCPTTEMTMTRQQSSTHDQGNKKHASNSPSRAGRGDTTVREAGHKGGQRVRELVNEGRQAEQRGRH
jgi:hypothetical protein